MSDSGTARIFQIDENGYKEWLADERLNGVNGMTVERDRLLIATMGTASLFETTGAQDLSLLADGLPNADGVAVLGDGSYLVTGWPGHIWHVGQDGARTELLNTTDSATYQNDLTRIGDLFVVPNWKPSTVTAWRWNTSSPRPHLQPPWRREGSARQSSNRAGSRPQSCRSGARLEYLIRLGEFLD